METLFRRCLGRENDMPRIYVEFGQLKQFGNDCKSISAKIEDIKSKFKSTAGKLDWDVKFMSDINNAANQLTRKLDNQAQALKSYQIFLNDTHDKYMKLDNEKFQVDIFQGITIPIGGSTTTPATDSKPWWESAWNVVTDVGSNVIKWTKENFSSVVDIIIGGAFVATGIFSIIASAGLSTPASVVAISVGINKIVGASWDIADGDKGSGKDFSDGLGWIVGKGAERLGGDYSTGEFVGKFIGTGIEIGAGAYAGIEIAQAARVATGATEANKIAKAAKTIKNVGEKAKIVGDYAKGDYVSGTTGLIFEILPESELCGRPTQAVTNYVKGIIAEKAAMKSMEEGLNYVIKNYVVAPTPRASVDTNNISLEFAPAI